MVNVKKRVLGHLNGITSRLMYIPRRMYHKQKAKRCNTEKCCIICNNCTGGMILHDLGLRFDSPTINTLFFSADDFLFFANNIKSIFECEIVKICDSGYPYPVGGIKLGNREIKIGFVHYSTFEEAKKKWIDRFKRVDFDKILVLWEGNGLNDNDLELLDKMSFHKLVFSIPNKKYSDKYPFYLGSNIYNNWYPGKILDYKHPYSLKRYLDDFDYIRFINNGT